MQVDSTGTRLAPRQFISAIEVTENARRVLAFRQKSWMKPVHVEVKPAPAPKPEVVIPPPTGLLAMILWPDEYTGNNFTRPSVRQVSRAISNAWPMDHARIIGPERFYAVVRPRQLAVALAKHLTLASYPAIGRAFGDRNHATIYHAVKKFAAVIEATAAQVEIGSPLVDWVRAAIDNLNLMFPAKSQPRTKTGLFCEKDTFDL